MMIDRLPTDPASTRFERRLALPVSAQEGFAWHARPGAFERLAPPWQSLRVVRRVGTIEDGDVLVFQVRQGPVALRWHARHEDYRENEQFVDVQERGPFAAWRHVHGFENDAAGRGWLHDHITYRLPGGALGARVAGGFFHRDLVRLFAYRHATTRDDLALHARYADRPRRNVLVFDAVGALGATVVGMLTTGGHEATLASGHDVAAAEDALASGAFDAVVTIDAPAVAEHMATRSAPEAPVPTLVDLRSVAGRHNQSSARDETPGHADATTAVQRVDLRAGHILVPGHGVLGPARQWARMGLTFMSAPQPRVDWISRDDAAAAVVHAVATPSMRGRFDLGVGDACSPRDVAIALRRAAKGAGPSAPPERSTVADSRSAELPALRHPNLHVALRYLLGYETSIDRATAHGSRA